MKHIGPRTEVSIHMPAAELVLPLVSHFEYMSDGKMTLDQSCTLSTMDAASRMPEIETHHITVV